MSDVIEQAYQQDKKDLTNWDRLYHWLEGHGGNEHDVQVWMEATQCADLDGIAFPQDAARAKEVMQKYKDPIERGERQCGGPISKQGQKHGQQHAR